MAQIPEEIQREVLNQQTAMGWPDYVPAFAQLPDLSGIVKWHRFQDLTIGLCEQLVEHHSRMARSILKQRSQNLPRIRIVNCAKHVLLARLFRCRYISLIGQQDSTEDDMPFAHMKW